MRAKLIKVSLHTLAALVLLVALLLWLIGREMTLRYAFDNLSARTNGMVTATGLRGGLYEGISFDRLVVKLPTQTITLDDGSILWEPAAFSTRTLLSRHARIGKITVEITGISQEPAREPADLLLPIELIIPALHVGSFEFHGKPGDKAGVAKPAPLKLAPLELSLQHRNRQWQIDSLSLATPWGQLSGQMQLGAVRPFPIAGTLTIDQKTGEFAYRAPVKLEGRLGDLSLASAFVFKDAQGNATARLAPFAEQLVTSATLDMPHFLPQRWNRDWPEADLAVHAALRPDGKTSWRAGER